VSSVTFLHAADLHRDSPLRGFEAGAPAEKIRGATRKALVNLVDLALQREVAFLILAGDLYDGDWKDWRTGQFLTEQLGRLKRAGIPVIAISGNHDAEQVLTKKLHFPGEMLRADKPETYALPELGVAIHGQSFATRAVTENLSLRYPEALENHFNIGLLHTACGSTAHDNYAPCSVADLARLGYQYWALGHVHTREVLARNPWVVFPGNPQGRHVKEGGAHGAYLVQVEDGRVAGTPTFVALDVLRWQQLSLDATGAADMEAVLARASLLLGTTLSEADGRLLVVRMTLLGACHAHAELSRDPEDTLQQLRAIAAEVAECESLWLEGVRVRTSPAIDEAALREQGGAVGALVAALQDAPAPDKELCEHVAEALRRAGPGLEADHPAHAVASGLLPDDLVRRARALLLAELVAR